jgi:hypothetical protein
VLDKAVPAKGERCKMGLVSKRSYGKWQSQKKESARVYVGVVGFSESRGCNSSVSSCHKKQNMHQVVSMLRSVRSIAAQYQAASCSFNQRWVAETTSYALVHALTSAQPAKAQARMRVVMLVCICRYTTISAGVDLVLLLLFFGLVRP